MTEILPVRAAIVKSAERLAGSRPEEPLSFASEGAEFMNREGLDT
jgi:hypothetical protein